MQEEPRILLRKCVEYEEYHPYGSTAWWLFDSSRGVSESRYKYTGMERDEETGLERHGLRYYVPWLGRWQSTDPVQLKAGINRYRYCSDDPANRTDANGCEDPPARTVTVLPPPPPPEPSPEELARARAAAAALPDPTIVKTQTRFTLDPERPVADQVGNAVRNSLATNPGISDAAAHALHDADVTYVQHSTVEEYKAAFRAYLEQPSATTVGNPENYESHPGYFDDKTGVHLVPPLALSKLGTRSNEYGHEVAHETVHAVMSQKFEAAVIAASQQAFDALQAKGDLSGYNSLTAGNALVEGVTELLTQSVLPVQEVQPGPLMGGRNPAPDQSAYGVNVKVAGLLIAGSTPEERQANQTALVNAWVTGDVSPELQARLVAVLTQYGSGLSGQ